MFSKLTARNKINVTTLGAGASDVFDSVLIPEGGVLVIRRFGCADDGSGDGKATVFRVQFGNEREFTDVRFAAINAGTLELSVNKEYISDGSQFFRVTATNSSENTSRNVAWWIEGYDR